MKLLTMKISSWSELLGFWLFSTFHSAKTAFFIQPKLLEIGFNWNEAIGAKR